MIGAPGRARKPTSDQRNSVRGTPCDNVAGQEKFRRAVPKASQGAKKNAAPAGPRNGVQNLHSATLCGNSSSTSRTARIGATAPRIEDLPFIRDRAPPARFTPSSPRPRSFWHVEPTGDYASDLQTGQAYADAAIGFIRATGFRPLLGWIVRDMIAAGQDSGVEIGFVDRIADGLLE